MIVIAAGFLHSSIRAGEPPPDIYVIVELEDGKVTDAHLTKSTGDPKLDAATIEKFKRWHFKPDKKAHRFKIQLHAEPIPNARDKSKSLKVSSVTQSKNEELEPWDLEQVVEMTAAYFRAKEDAQFEAAFAKIGG